MCTSRVAAIYNFATQGLRSRGLSNHLSLSIFRMRIHCLNLLLVYGAIALTACAAPTTEPVTTTAKADCVKVTGSHICKDASKAGDAPGLSGANAGDLKNKPTGGGMRGPGS